MVEFRSRLLKTLRAVQAVLKEPGTLIVGSEVPNLLQPEAAATLVVSQDVDIAIDIGIHAKVKKRLSEVRGLHPSEDEPSVWVPDSQELIEVNFLGRDDSLRDPFEVRAFEDPQLPLIVFGALSLVQPGVPLRLNDLVLPVPRPSGLMIEKLLTDRTGEKGDRDLLVVLGLLEVASDADLLELVSIYRSLLPPLRFQLRSSLTTLSLLPARPGMPDPGPRRAQIKKMLQNLESEESDLP